MRRFSTGFVRSAIGDPDLRSPSGFDSGLRPPLRMTRRAGCVAQGFVRSTFGDPDLRSPCGFDSGLRPPLRMTRGAGMGAQSLDLRRICWTFGVILKLEFTLDFRRYFLASRQIKKPSPVGEGGPRQWWMRSPRDRLTLCRHLIRQPSAATFSHWRRLSFVSALLANKYKPAFSNNYSFQSNTYLPKKCHAQQPSTPLSRLSVSS